MVTYCGWWYYCASCQGASPSIDLAMRDVGEAAAAGTVFSGWYRERVHAGSGYKDKFVVDAEEAEAVRLFKAINRRIRRARGIAEDDPETFTGLQKAGTTVALLVEPPPPTSEASGDPAWPFGHYWFLVEGAARGADGAVAWKVKILRAVLQGDSYAAVRCPHCGKLPADEAEPLDLSEVAKDIQRRFCDILNPLEWLEDARPYLTLSSVAACVKFLAVVLVAFFAGLAKLIPTVLQLLNRTIHESSQFLRQATPFLLSCVDVLGKIVGGFYMLIAMMWKDLRKRGHGGDQSPAAAALEHRPSSSSSAAQSRFPYRREAVQRPYF